MTARDIIAIVVGGPLFALALVALMAGGGLILGAAP